jgi:hypothetical protein
MIAEAPSVVEYQKIFHKYPTLVVSRSLKDAQAKLVNTHDEYDRECLENSIRAAAGVLRLRWRNWE